MNKYLLTGAVAAIAVAAGSAQAQSKFEVRMGGDAYFEAGFIGQDRDSGARGSEFRDRFRLNTVATAKADNGLKYGARLRLRTGSDGSVNNDRAYIFVDGGFGSLQLGTTTGPADNDAILGPVGDWGTFGGADGDWAEFLADTTTEDALPTGAAGALRTIASSEKASRVVYYSPEFSGFQFVGAYGPRMGTYGTKVNRTKNDGSWQDVYEVGVLFNREFGDVGVAASVFYEGGEVSAANTEDLSSWAAGLQISYKGFAIGGSYAWAGDSGYDTGATYKDDQKTYIVAAQYETGPVIIGASYTRSEGADENNFASGGVIVDGNPRLDLYQAGLTYTVAPGLTVGAEYSHFKLDTEKGTADDEGDLLVLITRVKF